MSKNTQLEKNLSDPDITGQLLYQAQFTVKLFRESLWGAVDISDKIPTMRAATILLEKSISRVVPEERNETDKNQLALDL